MKHFLLSISALLLSLSMYAQITITQADYGQAGDNVIVGYDDAPPSGLSVGGTGSQTWNFNSLSLSNINTLNFVLPAATASGASFPDADLAIERLTDTLFFKSSTSAFEVDGFAGAGFGLPISIVANFNPNSTQITFPSTLGTTFIDTAVFDTVVSCAEFGFGSTCDSARLKRVLVGSSNVNAYGTINTPGGNFETVRQYFREDNRDTVWIKIPFLGWTQFLDSASVEHNYRWIANDEKWPVLSARADAMGGDIISAEFIIGAQVLGFADSENDPSCNGGCNGSASVFAIGGVPPYSYTWSSGQTTAAINNLCAGSYTVTITDSDTGSYIVNIELADPTPIQISGAVQGVNVGNDGAIDISVSGGAGNYSYDWSGPDGFTATTQDVGNIDAGEYTVIVTDGNGCDTSRVFLVELTGIADGNDANWSVFPNPANDVINITAPAAIQQYRITNQMGQTVAFGSANVMSMVLSASQLASGIYMVEITTETARYTKKVMIAH